MKQVSMQQEGRGFWSQFLVLITNFLTFRFGPGFQTRKAKRQKHKEEQNERRRYRMADRSQKVSILCEILRNSTLKAQEDYIGAFNNFYLLSSLEDSVLEAMECDAIETIIKDLDEAASFYAVKFEDEKGVKVAKGVVLKKLKNEIAECFQHNSLRTQTKEAFSRISSRPELRVILLNSGPIPGPEYSIEGPAKESFRVIYQTLVSFLKLNLAGKCRKGE